MLTSFGPSHCFRPDLLDTEQMKYILDTMQYIMYTMTMKGGIS